MAATASESASGPHQHLGGITRQNFQHREHYGRCSQQGGNQREQSLEEKHHGNKAVKGKGHRA